MISAVMTFLRDLFTRGHDYPEGHPIYRSQELLRETESQQSVSEELLLRIEQGTAETERLRRPDIAELLWTSRASPAEGRPDVAK